MATNINDTNMVEIVKATSQVVQTTETDVQHLMENIRHFLIDNSARISAAIFLVVGVFVGKWVGNAISRTLEKKGFEPPIRMLMVRVSRALIFGMALMVALQTLGYNLIALITGLGVAGVGIGFALQGVLGNIFAGLTIIFTKPFRVGEYIGIVGVEGVVSQIELISTTLLHSDASRVVIPNHKIMGEILHNYGSIRQVDLSIGVGYTSDLNMVRAVVTEVLQNNPKVLKEPSPVIAVGAFNDSSITIAIKPWVKLADFGAVQTELNQKIIEKFRVAQIEVPFPQREVRILNPGPTGSV